jgi:hypothetical protein
MIQNNRVQNLINAYGLESTREGVQALLDLCIKKNHKCRAKYVSKELKRLEKQEVEVTKEEFKKIYPNDEKTHKWEGDVPEELRKELISAPEDLYLLHKEGKSWEEITQITGAKKPWVKASRYAKDNGFEYPIKQD